MKLYGRSKATGFHGVVLDDQDKVVAECAHNHPTRSEAEKCGRKMKEESRGKDQAS